MRSASDKRTSLPFARSLGIASTVVGTAVAAALSVASCGESEASWVSPVAFDTAQALVIRDGGADTSRVLVELAESGEQRAFGMMLRPSLDPQSGMVFLYDTVQPETSTFWMWRVRIPLDIAFIDSVGAIRSIFSMPPCESPYQEYCRSYSAGVEFRSALETNEGWFAEHGVTVGDRVVVVDSAGE